MCMGKIQRGQQDQFMGNAISSNIQSFLAKKGGVRLRVFFKCCFILLGRFCSQGFGFYEESNLCGTGKRER